MSARETSRQPVPRQQPGRDGLVFLEGLLGGPPRGWALETSSFSALELRFSLVKGPRRLEFSVSPQRRGAGIASLLRCSREELADDERELTRELSAVLSAADFRELLERLRRDSLLHCDDGGPRPPSRLERYHRVVDHSPDFWKFVYPEWRCLEEKVSLGAHWTRLNYATLECRLANPHPGAPSLRFFADAPADEIALGERGVEADITEADVVGGRTQALLGRALDEAAREGEPAYVHLNTTCMPELLGDTPLPFMSRIESELGVPVFWTSKTRPGGPVYSAWVERLLDALGPAPVRDPRAVLLAGVASPAARAQAEELCAALGLRTVGALFPGLDFRGAPGMKEASAVVWVDPVGWESISDAPFLRRGLAVVRHHPPYGVAGSRAWLGRVASVLGLEAADEAFARVQGERAGKLEAMRAECGRRTAALIGDGADLELLVASPRSLGFSTAALLGELGFRVRCLVFSGGWKAGDRALRRPEAPCGAGTIEFVPFATKAALDRELGRGVDLAFSHFNHDPRLEALGLRGFTEAVFEPGLDGLLRSGRRLLAKCSSRPFPRHRAFLPR